ncbi:ABC transporter permease [Litorilinea aerophila]|uniref:ABC transporter permease n=1 Tax=Litorilinea aerophila TaxID=1204385 RepID=A0A540VHE3_9CHLR|nr:ABC transporter permease [Litorilinea aerophila]MCC9076235.1 ABC transporter permease [Litorilinea aerophila]OUC06669.1 ABC transporter permease [Litorilinea aerophila]GIV79981.1 MAG: ABC transporter permease [Litorilinea sp.]
MTTRSAAALPGARRRLRLERRLEQPRWLQFLSPVILIAAALLVGGLLLQIAGANPWLVYRRMAQVAFGSAYGWSDTTVKATPLILAGLGVALAFRMRLWNIGAEGQLFLGAFMASGVALHWLPPETPRPLMLTAMAVAGFVGGALWGLIPGLLKAWLNVNEIITSLMLNYVAIYWNNYFIYGPWSQRGFGLTPTFPRSAWMPRFTDYAETFPALRGLTAHFGIFLGIGLALLIWLVLRYTRWGFEINVIGDNPRAARYAGIHLGRNIVLAMILSGGLAGLAGMSEVSGVVHRLQERFSPGYGFTAIIIAWLAKLNPLAIVLVAYLFGGLLVGGDEIQPAGIAQLLQGVILFVVVGGEVLLQYRVRWTR